MSEKFTPYFKTPEGKSLALPLVAKNFFNRQDLSPVLQAKPQLDQEIRIRVAKD